MPERPRLEALAFLFVLESLVTVALPGPDTRWRCTRCGNLTRFDVVRTARTREFWHVSLSGDPEIEETETLHGDVEQVSCRWCGASSSEGVIELIPRADAGADPTADSTPDIV